MVGAQHGTAVGALDRRLRNSASLAAMLCAPATRSATWHCASSRALARRTAHEMNARSFDADGAVNSGDRYAAVAELLAMVYRLKSRGLRGIRAQSDRTSGGNRQNHG